MNIKHIVFMLKSFYVINKLTTKIPSLNVDKNIYLRYFLNYVV